MMAFLTFAHDERSLDRYRFFASCCDIVEAPRLKSGMFGSHESLSPSAWLPFGFLLRLIVSALDSFIIKAVMRGKVCVFAG